MFFPEEKMRLVLQIQYRASCILQNVNAKNAKCQIKNKDGVSTLNCKNFQF